MRRAKERERIVSQSTCAFHLFRWQGRKKILFSTCALGGYLKASACCCWERRWRQMDLCLATHSGLSQWVGIRSSNFSKRVDNCDHEGLFWRSIACTANDANAARELCCDACSACSVVHTSISDCSDSPTVKEKKMRKKEETEKPDILMHWLTKRIYEKGTVSFFTSVTESWWKQNILWGRLSDDSQ